MQNLIVLLLVEDSTSVRALVSAYLTADGHTVESACDGAQGVDIFRHGVFDLVITDRAMPVMSGDAVAAAVKEHSAATPVIMLTGFGEMVKAEESLPDGVDLVVSKPIAVDELRKALASVATGM